jgi:cytidine deaminase
MTTLKKDSDQSKLLEAAKAASQLAYCVYSSYPVGVALMTFDGHVYTGCNIENCGFTGTIHAEQSAMASAIADGALHRALRAGLTQLEFISTVAVHAQKGTDPWPCCNCRQSLNEFGLTMNICGEGPGGTMISKTLSELIPHAFEMGLVLASVHGPNWQAVMQRAASQESESKPGAGDPLTARGSGDEKRLQLVEAAKEVSRFAYCPYSRYPVGAALLTFDDRIYTGCNIENCSYTQTIHAEQTAIAKAIAGGALKRALDAGLTQLDFIRAIAVYSPKNAEAWPSCHGRQALYEFGLDIEVIGLGKNGGVVTKTVGELVPNAFSMDTVMASVRDKG